MPIEANGYDLIIRYERLIGTRPEYIAELCDLARQENAPADAVHRVGDRWVTADQISAPDTRIALGLRPFRGPSAAAHPLHFDRRNETGTVVTVALQQHLKPVIGTARLDGDHWLAYPLGESRQLSGTFPTVEQAGRALADRVPADAVYYRKRWVTKHEVIRPSTRRELGLPILTPDQIRDVQTHYVADISDLVPPSAAARRTEGPARPAPKPGQPAIVHQGAVYWLAGDCKTDSTLIRAVLAENGDIQWDQAHRVPDWDENHPAPGFAVLLKPRTPRYAGTLYDSIVLGEGEARIWKHTTDRPTTHVLDVHQAHIAVELDEEGATCIRINAAGPFSDLHVVVDDIPVDA